jgi:hypothetical protein
MNDREKKNEFKLFDNKHSITSLNKNNKKLSCHDQSCIDEEDIEEDVSTDSEIDDDDIAEDLNSSFEASSTHVNELIIKNLSNLKSRYFLNKIFQVIHSFI